MTSRSRRRPAIQRVWSARSRRCMGRTCPCSASAGSRRWICSSGWRRCHGEAYVPANGCRGLVKNKFADGLREVARLIKARVELTRSRAWIYPVGTRIFSRARTSARAVMRRTRSRWPRAWPRLNWTCASSESAAVMITAEFGGGFHGECFAGHRPRSRLLLHGPGEVKGEQVLGDWPLEAMDETNPLGPGGVEAGA